MIIIYNELKNKDLSIKNSTINFLTEYIHNENLKLGDKLPSAMDLCEMIGVSLTTIRSALNSLSERGVLDIINGKGSYIKNVPNQNIVISASVNKSLEQNTLLEIFEVRETLERSVINYVIKKASDAELLNVQHRLDKLMLKYNLGNSTQIEDRLFHKELALICHNSVLQNLLESLMIAFYELYPITKGTIKIFDDTIPLHEEMFYYIRKRDFKNADKINTKSIRNVLKTY